MVIKTKYDISDNLYFIYDGVIRYIRPSSITLVIISSGENRVTFNHILYNFRIGKKEVRIGEISVYKRRADLIKAFEQD